MDRRQGGHHVDGQGVPDVPVVDRVAADDPAVSKRKEAMCANQESISKCRVMRGYRVI